MAQVTSNTTVWQELRARLAGLDKRVRVGVLQAAGQQTASDGRTTIAEIAAIHEFGAPRAGIPARSFLRATFQGDAKTALVQVCTKLATAVVKDKMSPERALGQLGAWAAGAIKKRIKDHIAPPLQPATIARKGSSTPLIDTGQLVNSITWEVDK